MRDRHPSLLVPTCLTFEVQMTSRRWMFIHVSHWTM